jgi:hypothetical protein
MFGGVSPMYLLLYTQKSGSGAVVQLLPVLVCIGMDGVWIMLEPGVLLFGPWRFFSFFAQRTAQL